ncbi:MAG: hypothetical protein K2W95_16295 [Candidatus Obscuribacterales bacterium]|nr:hypothetical protein [Candidatus Obscuribacterales bacterium]
MFAIPFASCSTITRSSCCLSIASTMTKPGSGADYREPISVHFVAVDKTLYTEAMPHHKHSANGQQRY